MPEESQFLVETNARLCNVEGMQLHRAFELYGVNYWTFVNRVPKFSRHYDSHIYELSGGQARVP